MPIFCTIFPVQMYDVVPISVQLMRMRIQWWCQYAKSAKRGWVWRFLTFVDTSCMFMNSLKSRELRQLNFDSAAAGLTINFPVKSLYTLLDSISEGLIWRQLRENSSSVVRKYLVVMENCSLSSGFQASNLVTGFHNIPHVDIDLNRIPADFQITLDYFEASLETLTFGIISYCSSWMVFPPIQIVLHCTWNYSGELLGFLNIGLSVTVGCCCLVFL